MRRLLIPAALVLGFVLAAPAQQPDPLVAEMQKAIAELDEATGDRAVRLTPGQKQSVELAANRAEVDYAKGVDQHGVSRTCWDTAMVIVNVNHYLYCLSYDVMAGSLVTTELSPEAGLRFYFSSDEALRRFNSVMSRTGNPGDSYLYMTATIRHLFVVLIHDLSTVEREVENHANPDGDNARRTQGR